MKYLLASLLLASACGGPSQQALAETPTATTKRTPAEAPAASGPEKERERMIQANDQMTDADNAHREAASPSNETDPGAPVPGKAQPKTKPV
jgi:hypothetical protein